jgi:drug/metabolite transporter (DMT)-like permease
MTHQKKAYLYAFIVIVCWSSVAAAFKLALSTVTPFNLILFSALVAFVFFTGIAAYGGDFRHISNRDNYKYAALGIINPFLFYPVLFMAYDKLPAQYAMSINFSWPLVLALLAVPILGQKLPLRKLLTLLLGFSGVVVIAGQGSISDNHNIDYTGIALVIFSTFIWSLYWLLNKKLDPPSEVLRLWLGFATGLILLLLTGLALNLIVFPNQREWLLIAYVGLMEMGIPFILWAYSLKYAKSAASVSVLIFFIPFLSLIVLHVVLGETIYIGTVLGLILIVGGLFLQYVLDQQTAKAKK